MNEGDEKTNFKNFLIYFIPLSIIISVAIFYLLIQIKSDYVIAVALIIHPIIISIIEGVLGTYFYFENRQRKVSLFTIIYLIIILLLSLVFFNFFISANSSNMSEYVFIVVFFCVIVTIIFMVFNNLFSYFTSKILTLQLPNNKSIKENILLYNLENFHSDDIFETFRLLSYQIFNYKYVKNEKQSVNDDNHCSILLKAASNEYLFLYLYKASKKMFILPLLLEDYRNFKCNDKEKKSIKSYLSVSLKINSIVPTNPDLRSFNAYFQKNTQSFSKEKTSFIKKILLICICISIIILTTTAIVLIIQHLINYITKVASMPNNTLGVAVIASVTGAIIGSISVLIMVGAFKRITSFFKSRLFNR